MGEARGEARGEAWGEAWRGVERGVGRVRRERWRRRGLSSGWRLGGLRRTAARCTARRGLCLASGLAS